MGLGDLGIARAERICTGRTDGKRTLLCASVVHAANYNHPEGIFKSGGFGRRAFLGHFAGFGTLAANLFGVGDQGTVNFHPVAIA